MYAYVLYIGGHGILYVLNLFPFRGQGAICEYFNLCIFGRRCCVPVKMDIERPHTMPHCSLCSICGSKYNQSLVAHQLIICLSCCKVSNNVDSFLLYSHATRSARVGNCCFFVCGRDGENWSEVDNRRETHYRQRRRFEWEHKWRRGYIMYIVLQI